MSNILNTPDTTASYSQQDIDQNKIMGIVNAASGKAKELPLVGNFRILK